MSVLVLGGARSGKSAYAEQLAAASEPPVLYVATATASDDEMAERIRQHRARRPSGWRTLEVTSAVALRVAEELGDARTLVLEDLTLLLSNVMVHHAQPKAEELVVKDVEAVLALPVHVIAVSNEVGMGLVPPYPLGRQFRDALGRVNQYAAARADEVFLMVAGLPLRLK